MTRAADWQARVGDIWAQEWRRTDRALAGVSEALDAAILAAAPAGPFRALDIGCGGGATSLALAAARPDADVLGADLSAALVEVARGRAVAAPNVRFVASAAQQAAAEHGPFDLLVSRHGVMFFDNPASAFAPLHQATAPGGALVFSCFDTPERNPWATLVTDTPSRSASYVPGPFAFADEATGRAFLERAGWRRPAARRVSVGYRVGEGTDPVTDAFSFLSRIGPAASALRDAAPADRPRIEERLHAVLDRASRDGVVEFPASAWIWTARTQEGA